MEQKRRWVSAITAGVSPEGQKLYMNISKTINQVYKRFSKQANLQKTQIIKKNLFVGHLAWAKYSCIQRCYYQTSIQTRRCKWQSRFETIYVRKEIGGKISERSTKCIIRSDYVNNLCKKEIKTAKPKLFKNKIK